MIKRLDAIVPKLLEKHSAPGIAIGFISGSEISSIKTYGYANKEEKKPVTKNTIFEIASISKSVTVWGIMKLVEKGLIDLDAPVETYLTRWHLPPSEFNHDEVTIRRVLSNTAGLSESGYSCARPDIELSSIEESLTGIKRTLDANELEYCKNWNLDPKREESSVKVIEQPGKKFIYSNRGFSILALIVEEITHKSFSEYMRSEILKPLGMNSSSFEISDLSLSLFATPYDTEGNPLPHYRSMEKAAGGLCCSIQDLAKFTLSSMKGSKGEIPGRAVLSEESIKEMFTKIVYTEEQFGYDWHYGLGHFITETEGLKIVQHSGGIIGWRSMMIFIPDLGAGIVVLINSSSGNPVWASLVARWSRAALKPRK